MSSDEPPLGVTPILTVADSAAAAEFYKQAYGAVEVARMPANDGSRRIMHLRLVISGSTLIVMDEFIDSASYGGGSVAPTERNRTTVTLHLQVENAASTWRSALEAGATIVVPMERQFWGELYGRVRDPFGHEWTIAQWMPD